MCFSGSLGKVLSFLAQDWLKVGTAASLTGFTLDLANLTQTLLNVLEGNYALIGLKEVNFKY